MAHDPSFDDLFARIRNGDPDAQAELFRRFYRRLRGLAQARLDHVVRGKVDPDDVLQSVYKSFFLRELRGDFELDGWDGLWALLAEMTVRKCGRCSRRFRSLKRNAARELSFDAGPDDEAKRDWEALVPDPTHDEALTLVDLLDNLMNSLEPRDRAVASMLLQGYTNKEIADGLQRSERTVQRSAEHIRGRLVKMSESS
ncbi:MAG: hypothetical protein KGM43_11175 [Planctomycetota bacterium]|nr:hypothetical protein [Planctomycetota bacterium]